MDAINKARDLMRRIFRKIEERFIRMPLDKVLIVVGILLIVTSAIYLNVSEMLLGTALENPLETMIVEDEVKTAIIAYASSYVDVLMRFIALLFSGMAVICTTLLIRFHSNKRREK